MPLLANELASASSSRQEECTTPWLKDAALFINTRQEPHCFLHSTSNEVSPEKISKGIKQASPVSTLVVVSPKKVGDGGVAPLISPTETQAQMESSGVGLVLVATD